MWLISRPVQCVCWETLSRLKNKMDLNFVVIKPPRSSCVGTIILSLHYFVIPYFLEAVLAIMCSEVLKAFRGMQ
jgi:hypothetical protein